MIVSSSFASQDWTKIAHPGINVNTDPARIAYGVMSGIGFLGAGTIIQTKGTVRGLTTAAALWCVAAMGLAAGNGLYLLTILSTICMFIALFGLDYIEDMIPKVRYRTVTVRVPWKIGIVAETVKYFKEHKMDVVDASFARCEDMGLAEINLRIAFLNYEQYYTLERQLESESDRMTLLATREL